MNTYTGTWRTQTDASLYTCSCGQVTSHIHKKYLNLVYTQKVDRPKATQTRHTYTPVYQSLLQDQLARTHQEPSD
jgi:hypothetical protein